jgi:hypothetical protein
MRGRREVVCAKDRTGKRLAVGAVTDGDRVGIDLRLKADPATMPMSVVSMRPPGIGGALSDGPRDQAKVPFLARSLSGEKLATSYSPYRGPPASGAKDRSCSGAQVRMQRHSERFGRGLPPLFPAYGQD